MQGHTRRPCRATIRVVALQGRLRVALHRRLVVALQGHLVVALKALPGVPAGPPLGAPTRPLLGVPMQALLGVPAGINPCFRPEFLRCSSTTSLHYISIQGSKQLEKPAQRVHAANIS